MYKKTLTLSKMGIKSIVLAATTLVLSTSVNAAVINIGTTNTGSSDCTIGCMSTYQQGYDSSLFGSSSIAITDFSIYAINGGQSGTYDVFMSYMNGDYTSISTDFENNISQPWSYFGSIDLASNTTDNPMVTAGSFEYDPSQGDLIIGYYMTSASANGGFYASSPELWSRAFEFQGAGRVYAESGYALNTTFSVSTVPVPAAAWLFGSGLIGLVGFARRKKA